MAPYAHEGALEIGPLVCGGGAEVAGYISAMVSADDRVLVAVGGAGGGGVGFGKPIGGADESGFGVDILGVVSWRRLG